jgi:uncharacterized protein YkwD
MKWGLCFGLVCLLAACGDAGTESGGARAASTGEESPLPVQCDAVQDWDPKWVALEQDMLRLINEHRVRGASCGGPTHALQTTDGLQCAARLHSLDMDERDFYQHRNPDGLDPRERMEEVGYVAGPWAENILKGAQSAEEAMDALMASPGHCANIMSPEFTVVGIGVHGESWTQNFSD